MSEEDEDDDAIPLGGCSFGCVDGCGYCGNGGYGEDGDDGDG